MVYFYYYAVPRSQNFHRNKTVDYSCVLLRINKERAQLFSFLVIEVFICVSKSVFPGQKAVGLEYGLLNHDLGCLRKKLIQRSDCRLVFVTFQHGNHTNRIKVTRFKNYPIHPGFQYYGSSIVAPKMSMGGDYRLPSVVYHL